MTLRQYPRPCPIPGHPQDEDEPALVTESAWSRLRAWHLHAPAERLPLPLVLTAWPAAWVMRQAHVPGHDAALMTGVLAVCTWLAWARHYPKTRDVRLRAAWERLTGQGDPGGSQPPLRFLPTEAALVTAAARGW